MGDIDLVFTTGTTNDIAERMLANLIDLGFTALPVDEREFLVITATCSCGCALVARMCSLRRERLADVERHLVMRMRAGHRGKLLAELGTPISRASLSA